MKNISSLVLIAALISGCASLEDLPPVEPTAYTAGSGDRLAVTVFRHEDLSGEYLIDEGGNVAMPLLGVVHVGGLTSDQAAKAIAQAYTHGGFLVDPKVAAAFYSKRPYYIQGEVNAPGAYDYVDGLTASKAIAIAGGRSYRAGGVAIRRGGTLGRALDTTPILPGDEITVNERMF